MELEHVRLHLFDGDHDIAVEENLDPKTSPHTGRILRRVRIALDVDASRADKMSTLLGEARDPEHPLVGEDDVRWSVLSSSHSYREGGAIHNFQAEIQEAEPSPQAERVEMLGLSLVPSRYKEEALDDGVLLISLLVSLNAEEDSTLAEAIERGRTEEAYFDALRVGVSDQPLSMRFGRCLWKRQDGTPLRLLRLVADTTANDEDDDSYWRRIHQPELIRAQEKIAALEDVVSALIERLVEADVLDEPAGEAIRSASDGSWERHVNDFDEAVDIESHF